MYMTYPYFPATGNLESTPNLNPRHTRDLITGTTANEEQTHMHQHLHVLDVHVQAGQQRRLQEAILGEQRRLAQASRRNRAVAMIDAIRITMGSMLISAGQRIAREERELVDARRETRPSNA